MGQRVTPYEAQAALDTVERGRRRVLEEVGLPSWYWWGLAVGWIILGVLADLDVPVVTAVATFAFGTANAAAMSRVASGRHRTSSLSVRASVAGRHVRAVVVGALVLLAFVTVGLALAAQADGADHPTTAASIVVAVVILLGGPRVFEVLKRKAADAPAE